MATRATDSIDRHSPTPFYQQLADILRQRVIDGRIEQDERLPSESALCLEFDLSRATVRQALRALEAATYARRIPNRGVFATQPARDAGWVIQHKDGFLENAISHQNRSVQTRVLRAARIPLPEHACDSLGLPPGSEGHELVRVRHLDGQPAVYSTNYSPPEIIPIITAATSVLAGQSSLAELLERAGYTTAGAHRIVRAKPATAAVAEALEIPVGTPLLHIRSTSWTSQHSKFDLYETWVCSDVVPLEVHVDVLAPG